MPSGGYSLSITSLPYTVLWHPRACSHNLRYGEGRMLQYWWAKELAQALLKKLRKAESDPASTISEQHSNASGRTGGSSVNRRQQRNRGSTATTQSSATTQSQNPSSIVDVESLRLSNSEGNNTGGQSQSDLGSHSSTGRDPRTPTERNLEVSCRMKKWQTEEHIDREPDKAPATQTLQGNPRELPDTPARGVEWLGGQRPPGQRTVWKGQRNTLAQIPTEHSTPKVVLERLELSTPRRGTREHHEPA